MCCDAMRAYYQWRGSERGSAEALDMVAEEVVLIAARAFRTFQAADKQDRHTHSHKDGQDIRVCRKPANHDMHQNIAHKIHSKT